MPAAVSNDRNCERVEKWPILTRLTLQCAADFPAKLQGERVVTAPKNDKFKDYARYAEYCLNMVASTRIRNCVASNAKWRPNG